MFLADLGDLLWIMWHIQGCHIPEKLRVASRGGYQEEASTFGSTIRKSMYVPATNTETVVPRQPVPAFAGDKFESAIDYMEILVFVDGYMWRTAPAGLDTDQHNVECSATFL
jgi:hypothetical protein